MVYQWYCTPEWQWCPRCYPTDLKGSASKERWTSQDSSLGVGLRLVTSLKILNFQWKNSQPAFSTQREKRELIPCNPGAKLMLENRPAKELRKLSLPDSGKRWSTGILTLRLRLGLDAWKRENEFLPRRKWRQGRLYFCSYLSSPPVPST